MYPYGEFVFRKINTKFLIRDMKKYVLLIVINLFTAISAFAESQSTQTLQSVVPEVLHIEKIIVDNVEYDKDAELQNVEIRQTEQIDEKNYRLSLNPFTVRITTNLADPIQVSAKFENCCSTCGRYPMKNEDLSVSPSSYTINNPHDKIETDYFVPQVIAHDTTVCTSYRAKLIITLGRV